MTLTHPQPPEYPLDMGMFMNRFRENENAVVYPDPQPSRAQLLLLRLRTGLSKELVQPVPIMDGRLAW